ncbi:MAG: helix-turn-helix transcriptional regulator [Pseudacidovorax sp.]|uniref:helix-turn-helix transcriptional regulator n=1 Tax=Pseudacidovorax sp. TaxID=1934311 RepID=UPI001B48F61F|nr:helix-turn-helix domain-containing protein [Pseudacidovorax sp.]MBP6892888.1 helix-turn-helix transcriptional regulator [Pseudacidovorax sp.]
MGSSLPLVLERQLLLQLGDRLKAVRKSKGLSMADVAREAQLSRTTLTAIEAGDPGPSMGNYARVMSVLGIVGDLALLAGDGLQAAAAGTAGARSRRRRPTVQVTVSTDEGRHQAQDLQSLALHEAAVRMAREDPALLAQAHATLQRWMEAGSTRSTSLWHEWEAILASRSWHKVLSRSQRAAELRQASPLTAVLPASVRADVLAQVRALKGGVQVGACPMSESEP